MKSIFRGFLLLTIISVPVFSQIEGARTEMRADISNIDISCKEASQNVGKVKTGMKESEVRAELGNPQNIEKGVWSYSFWDCMPMPKPGTQTVVGVAIVFKDHVVSKIDYATICVLGSGR